VDVCISEQREREKEEEVSTLIDRKDETMPLSFNLRRPNRVDDDVERVSSDVH
jgi:hypothetical protein